MTNALFVDMAPKKAWGPNKKAWDLKKGKTKEAILSQNVDFGRLSRFPENVFLLGSFSEKQIGFIAPEMVPWLSRKSEDKYGGPRTNLEVFGDEVILQYFPKT